MAGDEVAMSLFDEAGECAAQSAAGCIRRMTFREDVPDGSPVPIVLIGSIWNRVVYDGMRDSYLRAVQELTGRACLVKLLEAPPAVGGMLRAKEKADGKVVTEECRQKALDSAAIMAAEKEFAAIKERGDDADLLRQLVVAKKNRPQTAAKLDIDRQILDLLAKYPLLKGIGTELAAALLPAISSIIRGDCPKALERLASAPRRARIAPEEMAQYYNLAAACASSAAPAADAPAASLPCRYL